MWLMAACCSAFFAGLTAILAKCGIKNTDSDVATALRTAVVLLFSWMLAFVTGSAGMLREIETGSLVFLILSGLATGASWLCYFKALSLGDVNKVVPIDKSSTVLSVLFAILLFGETSHLAVKLVGTAVLTVGIFLMTPKRADVQKKSGKGWFIYAILSAVFAAFTSILAKAGIAGVESNLATAVRTGVVLVMAWFIVLVKGKLEQLKEISRSELTYIILSGMATGASWLCYYYAIQNGMVSVVVPLDKLSVIITVFLSYIVFKEKLDKRSFAGLCMMGIGILVIAVWS